MERMKHVENGSLHDGEVQSVIFIHKLPSSCKNSKDADVDKSTGVLPSYSTKCNDRFA